MNVDSERRKRMDLPAKVDTRAFMIAVPGSMPRKLGIITKFTQDFRTADGGIRSVDVAYTCYRWGEFNRMGVPIDEATRRFKEGMEILTLTWTDIEPFDHHG